MPDTLKPGVVKFVMAVSGVSAHLGKCSAIYENMGCAVAVWDTGKTTIHLADEDDVYLHYDASPAFGLTQAKATELLGYAGSEGIPVGGPAPPKP